MTSAATSDGDVAIRLEGLTKRYPAAAQPAVDALDLTINRGELVALVGPSGCGKTTTLKMINRLIEPTEGTVWIDGTDARTLPAHELRRGIGYVIQQTGLFPHRSIEANIATVPTLMGWGRNRTADRVRELADLLGLEHDMLRRYPSALSGGQQQRVGVARALAARPALLLMDEPFGALDPLSRQVLQRELARIQRALGCTIVLVTHDIDEALLLGQQLVLLDHGRVVQAGTPHELLARPASDAVRDFLGRATLGQRLLGQRRVAEVLRAGESADGAALLPDQSLQDALAVFLERRVERLPVADAMARPLGAIHFVDLLRGPDMAPEGRSLKVPQ
jgi:osmoprotectant transport system ATP-binding protein